MKLCYQGNVLSGIFKNNYFIYGEKFVNPFISKEDMEIFIKSKNEIALLKEKNNK